VVNDDGLQIHAILLFIGCTLRFGELVAKLLVGFFQTRDFAV